jgi:hypothetical protein
MTTPHSDDLRFVLDIVDETMRTLRRQQGSAAGQQGVRATIEYACLRAWKRGAGEEDPHSRARGYGDWDDSTPVSPLASQAAIDAPHRDDGDPRDPDVTRNWRKPQ